MMDGAPKTPFALKLAAYIFTFPKKRQYLNWFLGTLHHAVKV
jgi:hypothetical protein